MIHSVHITLEPQDAALLSPYDEAHAEQVQHFHRSFPAYAQTPLTELPALAAYLGLAGISIKDESFRFGLNAFKVLGGSYAMGRFIADRLDIPALQMNYPDMISPETRRRLGDITFITATDGNHGRGVAYTAAQLGQRCIVLLPAGTVPERLQNIAALGAEASITQFCYDDTVRLAASLEAENGYVLIQDTAWEGYEEIPARIMQGYTTLAREILSQQKSMPTHLLLQAGVGSMAAAVAACFAQAAGPALRIIIVEPEDADCIYQSAKAGDGLPHATEGSLHSIMAGLCCGEPCTLALKILRQTASDYVTITDDIAALGMRVLGNPLPGDPRIVSGESGASTTGFLVELMRHPAYGQLRDELGLCPDSRVLCISTEGATDLLNYRAVVWNGKYPTE